MKILQERQVIEAVTFALVFVRGPGSWYEFLCDEAGTVNLTDLQPAARQNYLDCVTGAQKVEPGKVVCRRERYTHPAVGQCRCGNTVVLDGFTNTCERCGADYNWAGQRLAPREQWGEETGESLSDILAIP